MVICFVIHTGEDASFVTTTLAPALSPLGFDQSVSSLKHPGVNGDVVIAVVPAGANVDDDYCRQAESALAGHAPLLTLYLGQRNTTPPNEVLARLENGASVDAQNVTDDQQRRRLAVALMDAIGVPHRSEPSAFVDGAERVEWSPSVFSALLAEAVKRHDYNRGAELLRSLERHLARREGPYPSRDARADLKTLRSKRQFLLMRRYAAAVLKSACNDFQVRRQLGQALIELKALDEAIEVLTALVADTTPPKDDDSRIEQYEGRGLLGRAHKQKYVDSGRRAGNELLDAIEQYERVFVENSNNVWHGINAATCILCAGKPRRRPADGRRPRDREEGPGCAGRAREGSRRRQQTP